MKFARVLSAFARGGVVLCAASCLMAGGLWGCGGSASVAKEEGSLTGELRAELQQIADEAPGRVGIAVICPDGDTLTVNNAADYQMMSVFKLHEAIAVAHALDVRGIASDTVISFNRSELDADTWSPMLKEHQGERISLPVSELLKYIIQQSDNNASNLLFDRVVSVGECDEFIRRATGIDDFSIKYTEGEMKLNHDLADGNCSSPLACARLMEKVFSDSLVSAGKQAQLRELLLGCRTGQDRIAAPLSGRPGVRLAHKTGSGFRDSSGLLMAHNDVGRVSLPDGRSYVLAVMVKDFGGSEADASAVIADVSAAVFNAFSK